MTAIIHRDAFIGSGEVIIELSQDGSVRVAHRKDAERRVKRNEVRAALEAAAAAFDDLVDLWEQYHG